MISTTQAQKQGSNLETARDKVHKVAKMQTPAGKKSPVRWKNFKPSNGSLMQEAGGSREGLNTNKAPTKRKPMPYPEGLTSAASPLRPHVVARERLQLWKPARSSSSLTAEQQQRNTITEEDLKRVFSVMNAA